MKLILASLIILSCTYSYASSCCGGGGGNAQLMLGDTKSVWRSSYLNQSILGDSDSEQGVRYRPENELESIRTFTISHSYRFSDFWQVGLLVPIIEKSRRIGKDWKSDSGLGDLQFNLGYEFYPEFNRSSIISQGFIYSQITVPSAPSIYSTERNDLLDTRGSGHFYHQLGVILKKRQRF